MEDRIGHYRIVGELGRGGMGAVYKAHEESLNRFVAIKVLGEHLAQDQEYVARFLREAKSAAALSHPNIVQIYFIGEDHGRHYLVMEYVAGRTLQQVLQDEGPLEPRRSARFVRQAAEGLAAAHDHGIIHRDIKPANLLLDRRDHVKIADFGLAVLPGDATRLTATGMFLGTPGYLSPEQCRGEDADHRSDIYSLGVTWYELLTGVMPFAAPTPAAVLVRILQTEPEPIETLRPDLEEPLRSTLARMIAKDPKERFTTAYDIVQALEEHGSGYRISERAATAAAPTRLLASTAAPVPPPPPLPPEATVAPPASGGTYAPVTTPGSRWAGPAVLLLLLLLVAVGAYAGARQLGWLGAPATGDTVASSLLPAAQPDSEGDPATDPATTDELAGTGGVDAGSREFGSGTSDAQVAQLPPAEAAVAPPAVVEEPAHRGPAGLPVEQRGAGATAITAEPQGPSRVLPRPHRPGDDRLREQLRDRRDTAEPTHRRPRPRGVVVAAVGEPILAAETERALEERLSGLGAQLVDESSLPEAEAMFRRGSDGPPIAVMLAALREQAGRLVLVRAQYLGQRELYYLGRYDTALQSELSITVFDLWSGKPLTASWSDRVEYTALSVPRVVEKALLIGVPELLEQARER
jgi:serine/threonine-protein kinase